MSREDGKPALVARTAVNPWLVAAAVVVPTFMEVLDSTIANVALRYIAGGISAVFVADLQLQQFVEGVRLGYDHFQLWYSLIKATLFGAAIAYLCTFEGYVTEAGAEGVGKSTAKAVVITMDSPEAAEAVPLPDVTLAQSDSLPLFDAAITSLAVMSRKPAPIRTPTDNSAGTITR